MNSLFDGGTSWDENETYICNTLNKTSLFTKAYNGIPETLILNLIAWLLLIVLFSTLRHQAGDYGRLALVNDRGNRKRWTDVFYSRSSSSVEQQQYSPNTTQELNIAPTTSTGAAGSLHSSGATDNCIWEQNQPYSSDTTPLSRATYDQGAFSWILITLKLQNSQILTHTGPDAVYYLSFQKHLMLVMSIVTAVSLLIILPINFFGGSNGTEFAINAFGRTTMANLPPDSAWLWAHVIVSIIYAPLIVLIMRRSSGRNAFKTAPTRSIMITNISRADRNDTVIRNYIQELFPDVNIDRVEVAYNISKLIVHNGEYERAVNARIYCENHREKDSLTVRSQLCSCKRENAYEFYKRTECDLAGHIARLQASAFNEPLGIAFLTVSTVQEAQKIVAHFTPGTYRQWSLTFAPTPDDIFWEHLSVSRSYWLLKWALVNITLFLVLFFLTTPAMIVNIWDSLSEKNITALSPIVSDFLSTFILWILSILLPVIVTISDKWMSHYTRSKQNYSIMTKCFAYLLFMILILPSLGLTSAQALLEWSVSNNTMRWQCIFLPDRGSFYINYIITSGFIGTAMELLRFPELIVYTWMLITAKSKAETPYIRQSILIEFPFGSHYAWTTLIFTISIVYSIFCPLIMPFAMIYICFKHFADRHNLYFAYGPSNMISRNGGKIHSTAVTMTKFSVVILLLVMAMISAIRGAGMARAVVLIVTLVITLTLFTFMSPIKRCTQPRRNSLVEVADAAPIYIPDVLKKHKHNHSIAMHNHLYSRYSNGRNASSAVAGNNFRAYGSGSVSDFDISSQNSINSADA